MSIVEDLQTEWWLGDKIEVECLLRQETGQTETEVLWFKDGERVSEVAAKTECDGQRLIIDQATARHSGAWVCARENNKSQDRKQVKLTVQRRTELVGHPRDLEFMDGKEAMFQCVVEVDPSLEDDLLVQWLRNGEEVAVDPWDTKDCQYSENGVGGNDTVCDSGSTKYNPEVHPCELETGSKFILSNHSLLLCNPTREDLGNYSCQVSSHLEENIKSQAAEFFILTGNFNES